MVDVKITPPPQSRRRVGSLVFVRQTLLDTSKVISVQKSTQALFFLNKEHVYFK